MFRNGKFLGFVHSYNLLEYFQNKEIDSNKTLWKHQYTNGTNGSIKEGRKQQITLLPLRKERRYQYVKCLSRLRFCPLLSLKLKRGRSTTPTSSEFELFYQYGNYFLILCCHKELHHRWCGGPRSDSDLFVYCAKHCQKD